MKKLELRLILIFLSFLVTTTYCAGDTLFISWSTIPIQRLPFSIEACDSSNVDSIRESIRNSPYTSVVAAFSPNTFVNERLYSGDGIDSTARFYKRLPDRYGFKVVIFSFLNQADYDVYPAYSIQTLDNYNRCIDKMVICSYVPGGCAWKRSFACMANGRIVITDSVEVLSSDDGSEENPQIVLSRENTYMYIINPHGRFVRWYPQEFGYISKPLKEECDDTATGLYEERGQVKNHLREGYWLVAQKRESKNDNSYIQRKIYYQNGESIAHKEKTHK